VAGLTSTGFEAKSLDTVLAEIEADEKNLLGLSLNVRPTSVMGVINGVFATKLSELWDVANEVWASQHPDTATGVSLDQLCQITGVLRQQAKQSTVTLSLSGTPGTPIEALRRVKHNATGTYWTNPLSATIEAASAVLVDFVSEDFGAVAALAGSLTIIDTPVAGWSAVTNPLDAALGQNTETDAELRARRARLLVVSGKGTLDAIRADVLAVPDVDQANVYENTTLVTDADGVPGKAFEVVVIGGTNDAIAQAIWDSKPAGISAYGGATGTALDALSASRVVAFTRPTEILVHVALTAVTASGWQGATADIAQAIVDYGATYQMGDDVVRAKLLASYLEVQGVADDGGFCIGIAAAPTGTANIAVGSREIARFDTSRILVALS
jgi:uncharacterized phage protein gp47/JayE